MNSMKVSETNVIDEPVMEPQVQTGVTKVANWLTVERALYGVLGLVALGLRFFALGEQPLNWLEAANAWPAWLALLDGFVPPPEELRRAWTARDAL